MGSLTKTLHILILNSILNSASSANILFISVIPSVSHQKAFQPIWRELSMRGHDVHVVTSAPLNNPALLNLTEYDTSSLFSVGDEIPHQMKINMLKKPSFIDSFRNYVFAEKFVSRLTEESFKHKEMKRLLKNKIKFDLVISEWHFPTMGALSIKYRCPLIGILSASASATMLDSVGNPSHPITIPDHTLPLKGDMSFQERLFSVIYSIFDRIMYHLIMLPKEDRIVKKYLGDDLPYIGDIERSVSLLLLNTNSIFHRPMPTVPSIIEFGGINLDRMKSKLDSELQSFLDKSHQGVIYFSFGSNMRTMFLNDEKTNLLLNVFRKLPYNVVFKWEKDTLYGKPTNVYIAKWFPQLAVLEHPNTKLFITQGGLQSCEEAIIAEVPIIGVPGPNDQTSNVDTFVKYGAGIALDLDYLTAKQLNFSIYEIMEDASYRTNIKILANIIRDQPSGGLERAVWWIEYVIRHKGAKHLRSPILDIPWWQYFLLDVIGFLGIAFSLTIILFRFLFKKVYTRICRGKK